MKIQRELFFFIFIILFSYVMTTSNSLFSFSINEDNETFAYLPNEFSKLLTEFTNTTKYSQIEKIEEILGYLPNEEQLQFYNSIDTQKIFNLSTYETNLELILQKEILALQKYITNKAKQLVEGFSCFSRMMTLYDDGKMKSSINDNIDQIIKAQQSLTECEMNYIENVFNLLIKRRGYLLEKNSSDFYTERANFIKENRNITVSYTSYAYTTEEANEIVNYFKDWSLCSMGFNNYLKIRLMELEILIGQSNNCFNNDNLNQKKENNTEVPPKFIFKNGELIGIHDGYGKRPYHKTQSNYTISNTFNNSLYGTVSSVVQIPSNWSVLLDDNLTLSKLYDVFENKNELINILKGNSNKKPFSNLHRFIIQQGTINEITYNLTNIANIEKRNVKGNLSYKSIKNESIKSTNPFIFTDYSIEYQCITDSKNFTNCLIFTLASNSLTEVYDIFFNGVSLSNIIMNSIEGCINAFNSGGKKDKEKCRGIFNEQCGRDIDKLCKISNLYETMNFYPVANKAYPSICEAPIQSSDDSSNCLDYIRKNYLLGGIAIKPSSFLTIGLLTQSYSDKQFTAKSNTIAVDKTFSTELNIKQTLNYSIKALQTVETLTNYFTLASSVSSSYKLKMELIGILLYFFVL